MRAVPVALATLVLASCAEPLESRVFPSPIHRVSLGMSPGLLARERPATEPVPCGDAADLRQPRCLRERRPVAGFRSVEYRFSDDRLVEIRAELEPSPFVPGAVETRLAAMKGLDGLGAPEVRLEARPFVRRLVFRWAVDGRRVEAAFLLEDPSAPNGDGRTAPKGESLFRPSLSLRAGIDPAPGAPSSLRGGQDALAGFADRVRLRSELLAGAWAARPEEGYCRRFGELVPATSLCEAARAVIDHGRVGAREREAIDHALETRGYRAFSGTVVARVGDGLYEVEPARPDGRGLLSTAGPAVVIRTPEGDFGKRGRVSLRVRPATGERPGAALEEDAIGAAVRRLYTAPPGDDARAAARDLLARLVRETSP